MVQQAICSRARSFLSSSASRQPPNQVIARGRQASPAKSSLRLQPRPARPCQRSKCAPTRKATEVQLTYHLQDFDRSVKTALGKGKALSSSTVESLVKLAMANVAVSYSTELQVCTLLISWLPQSDAQLVSTLYKHHKRCSSASKLYSLYLIDAIARDARSQAKKAAKGKDKQVSASALSSTAAVKSDAGGTCATFLSKLEAVLSKLVVDCWESGQKEHRVSLSLLPGIRRRRFGERERWLVGKRRVQLTGRWLCSSSVCITRGVGPLWIGAGDDRGRRLEAGRRPLKEAPNSGLRSCLAFRARRPT